MSLTDLRKKPAPPKTVLCSIDEFIDNAQNYARGFDNRVTVKPNYQSVVEQTAKLPFRKATFTLSEVCIELLAKQASQSDCAKSQLIRILIRHFDEACEVEQRLILERYRGE
jgi:hypothetical protein